MLKLCKGKQLDDKFSIPLTDRSNHHKMITSKVISLIYV